MREKRPQSTATLISRLRRVAKWLDDIAIYNGTRAGLLNRPALSARANTCLQAAGRLALLIDESTPTCESCSLKATQQDDNGVPLCDACYAGLER